MVEIVSVQTLRERRRAAPQITLTLPYGYRLIGQRPVQRVLTLRMAHGELPTIQFDRPVGELLTTPAGLETVLQRYVIDLALGREGVPTVYQPLYRTTVDANLPQLVSMRSLGGLRTIFLPHMEGEEIAMGARVGGEEVAVPILCHATMWQRTEEVSLYDDTWSAAEQSRATGEAYNALLNHLHLWPFINQSTVGYPPDQIIPAVTDAPPTGVSPWDQYLLNIRRGMINALRTAAQAINPLLRRTIRPTVILANSSRRADLETAQAPISVGGSTYSAVPGVSQNIYYDGYATQVGQRFYEYEGCPTDRYYLIEPYTYCRSLVKHDLRTDADNADISRLIEMQLVSRARLGVYCAPAACAYEVLLPTSP